MIKIEVAGRRKRLTFLLMIVRQGLKRHFRNLMIAVTAAASILAVLTSLSKAGELSFSDELGGFAISRVTGTGKQSDPVIIIQSLVAAGPVKLIIRRPQSAPENSYTVFRADIMRQAMTFVVHNDTARPWVGFDFELQEVKDKPSVFGDGLSFDQPGTLSNRPFVSDSFVFLERNAEPYDRLQFREGSVSPGGTVRFDVNLVDITPVREFYLLLHPIVPYS